MTEQRPGRPARWQDADEGYGRHRDTGYVSGETHDEQHGYDHIDGLFGADDHDGYYYDQADGDTHGGLSDEHPHPNLPPGYSDHDGWPELDQTGAPSYRRAAEQRRRAGQRQRPAGRRGRRLRHPVLSVLALAVVLVVLIVAGGLLWAQGQINPGGKRGPAVSVVIP